MNTTLNTGLADKLDAATKLGSIAVKRVTTQGGFQHPQPNHTPYIPAPKKERNDFRGISTNVDEETWRKAEELRGRFNIAIAPMIRSAVTEAIQRRWERERKAG